jgi:uncharacterized protein YecE (DUF72 family)
VHELGERPVRIGCSGWNYAHWRHGVFYPERLPQRLWLDYYARFFDTVEVNSTFYRLPRRDAVANWVVQSPPRFEFAIKSSRYLTHIKRLTELGPGLQMFYDRIEPMLGSAKMGPILWQLPPSFKRDDARLRNALAQFPKRQRHCVEFRHASWFVEETYAALREHDVALVIGDRPEVNEYRTMEITADFTFVRFHGGTRGRNGNYSESEIVEWSERVAAWAHEIGVYAYFNNDWEGFAPRNALRMKELLGLA